jgi:hypothetical protein
LACALAVNGWSLSIFCCILFFITNQNLQQMEQKKQLRYYITEQQPGNLQIIKVQQADVQNFLEDYGRYVLAAGDSLGEAMKNFNPPDDE